MTIRDPSVLGSKGKMVHYTGPPITSDVAEEFGGEGAYTSALSYLKVLHSLLVDDKKLLSKKQGVDVQVTTFKSKPAGDSTEI
ncbi:hypothetical protein POJ06DRAFT_292637 [Lipomyces tetrasporus]|uniref:Uncharacterized protein n=1 Tax=Lipomyces tetrasporus TaxID=54092 RepID=A0AAD7VQH7_9ASCO|nr:uncharacterized protein POJ06DRAFT_292637 [Lipomyces tetrasporus]KAJ8098947.1 hypothetical protein POJ06DRAFT_292637 [Lipomyces tetrasporus]